MGRSAEGAAQRQAAAAERAGLPEPLAMELARGTVVGAGELARQSAESAAQLRTNVTSPGGTTAAALAGPALRLDGKLEVGAPPPGLRLN